MGLLIGDPFVLIDQIVAGSAKAAVDSHSARTFGGAFLNARTRAPLTSTSVISKAAPGCVSSAQA